MKRSEFLLLVSAAYLAPHASTGLAVSLGAFALICAAIAIARGE